MRTTDPKLAAERDAKLEALGPRPPWRRPFARRRWLRARAAILATDVSTLAALMREVYSTRSLEQMADRRSPFLSLIERETEAAIADAERREREMDEHGYAKPGTCTPRRTR